MMVRGAPRRLRCTRRLTSPVRRHGLVLLASALATLLVVSGAASDKRRAKVMPSASAQRRPGRGETGRFGDADAEGIHQGRDRVRERHPARKTGAKVADKMAQGGPAPGRLPGLRVRLGPGEVPRPQTPRPGSQRPHVPVAYVMTQTDNKARGCGDLAGQSLSIPPPASVYLRLYVERQCESWQGAHATIAGWCGSASSTLVSTSTSHSNRRYRRRRPALRRSPRRWRDSAPPGRLRRTPPGSRGMPRGR